MAVIAARTGNVNEQYAFALQSGGELLTLSIVALLIGVLYILWGEYDEHRAELTVSGMVRRADGVHLRLVDRKQPLRGATPVAPDLETAYLLLMREASASAGAGH